MFLTILLTLSAFGLSSIAGYYSVAGMTAIFAASWWPIVIMTGTLEFSKIVVSSWLYRNWHRTPRFMKIYFTAAVFILMFITSLGIFGYLSKAHIDQLAGVSDNPLFIQQIDQQIATEQARVDDNRKIITQMDSAVGSMLSQSTSESAQRANKGVNMAKQANALRTSQQKDRTNLNKQIDEANSKIRELNKEKLKLEQEQIKIEAEVGPIKYIAQMIYGDNPDKNLLEKAVRYIIVLIIIVFDPLAILMFMAANMSLAQWQEERKASAIKTSQETELTESKKKEHTDFIHVDKVEIKIPEVNITEDAVETVVDTVNDTTDTAIDTVSDVIQNIDFTDIMYCDKPDTDKEYSTFKESLAALEELPESVDIDVDDLVGIVTVNSQTDIDKITINDLILLQDLIEESIEEQSTEQFVDNVEIVNSLIKNHFIELPLVDDVEETIQVTNNNVTVSSLEPDDLDNPLIDLVDEILKLAEDLVETNPESTPEVDRQIELLSNITEPTDDFENQDDVTYIDGKPIEDFLEVNTQESDEKLQLVTIPGITKKSDDILSTIKRYHNVRMEDARRTLR